MSYGEGCTCGARYWDECCCEGADWTTSNEASLLNTIVQMKCALERIAYKANTLGQKKQIARDALVIDKIVSNMLDKHKENNNNEQ